MRMTTKSRYAVRALVNLWQRHDHDHPTPLSEIAAEEDISLNFLEQIFMALRREGIVNSVRGPAGGYSLGMPPEEVSLAMIIKAVGEPVFPVKCVDDYLSECPEENKCYRSEKCRTRWAWLELGKSINDFLENLTLDKILERKIGA